ncbi:FAR1 domain-containing protein [Heracleum sosnowskyi]|uniref:FAR1 domain-containing protein n=1 Tax=Heracleum sosnowskyi TaxID=360622 RepID=A0AAD8HVE4_9APIA|nr:FAR1 domain-containing protein [Heracleum sosnowskyi]
MSSVKWIVTKFVKEHTHSLTPGRGSQDSIYDQYQNEHDKIKELTQQLAMERTRACTYKRHLELIFEHVDEHNELLSVMHLNGSDEINFEVLRRRSFHVHIS